MSDKTTIQKPRFLRPRGAVNEASDGRLQVILEMPGVGKDGLEVRIENNELRVTGRRDPSPTGRYVLRERVHGDFLQTYTLDETVDQSRVDAVLEKGILTLTLDLKEHVKPRTIAVRGE